MPETTSFGADIYELVLCRPWNKMSPAISVCIFELLIHLSLVRKVVVLKGSFICVYELFVFWVKSRPLMSKFRPDSVVMGSSPSQCSHHSRSHACSEGWVLLLERTLLGGTVNQVITSESTMCLSCHIFILLFYYVLFYFILSYPLPIIPYFR